MVLIVPISAARADTCAVVQEDAFEVGVTDSVDPSLLETSDPARVERSAELPSIPRAPTLLCTSGSDPRCSPLEATNTPSSPDMPAQIDADLTHGVDIPAVPLRALHHGLIVLMGPAHAPHTTLDRPPRA